VIPEILAKEKPLHLLVLEYRKKGNRFTAVPFTCPKVNGSRICLRDGEGNFPERKSQ
jgi:hypothetical protein